MSAESRSFWNQSSQVSAFPASTGALPYEIDLLGRAIDRAAASGPVANVHVIGVGTGRELAATRAVAPEASITAWDISEQMVEQCRDFVERSGFSNVEVRCADMTELSDDDGPADVVVLLNAVLCYLGTPAERRAAFASMRRLTRPGGAIAAVVHQPNGRPDWAAWFTARGLLTRVGAADGVDGDRRISHGGETMLFHHYRPSEATALLESHGFDDVSVESLRAWARSTSSRIPLRSPNPLLLLAS